MARRIVIVPDRLRETALELRAVVDALQRLDQRLGASWSALHFEVRQRSMLDADVQRARRMAGTLGSDGESLRRYLATVADRFTAADQQGAKDLEQVVARYRRDGGASTRPIPTPVPTPSPERMPSGGTLTPDEAVRAIDDLLKPIDLASGSRKGARALRAVFESLGRTLNAATGTRGHVKALGELSDVLSGTAKSVANLATILDARDLQRYFAGELTNAAIARVAIENLAVIPILKDRIADWAIKSMPNPDGIWKGLAPPAE